MATFSARATTFSLDLLLPRASTSAAWAGALTAALPSIVAPRKEAKGMRNRPQQTPQRSNKAFGHAASKKTPQKPLSRTKRSMSASARAMARVKKVEGGEEGEEEW